MTALAWALLRGGTLGRLRTRLAGVPIIAYHRVNDSAPSAMTVSTRRFGEQMTYLRRSHHLLTLTDLADALGCGAPLPPNAVVITFDDGYRDNVSVAAPIMATHGMRATLFAATGPAQHGEPLWWDALELAGLGDPGLRARMKYLPHAELRRQVSQALTGVPRGRIADAVAHTYLDWQGLRAWCDAGMELGAHTVTHPILAGLAAREAEAEVRGSCDALARHTGRQITSFSYPNGAPRDFTSETMRIVDRAHLRVACTMVAGLNTSATPQLALRRVCARNEPLALFALRLSGLDAWSGGATRVTARRLMGWLVSAVSHESVARRPRSLSRRTV